VGTVFKDKCSAVETVQMLCRDYLFLSQHFIVFHAKEANPQFILNYTPLKKNKFRKK